MAMSWFRMYTEFLTDPLIRMLAFEDQRHFVAALCLKASGVLDKEYPSPEVKRQVIASTMGLNGEVSDLGHDLGQNSLDAANGRLRKLGLVDQDWQPRNWEKRQFQSDSSTERTRKYRQNRHSDGDATSQERSGDALEQNRTEQNKNGQTPSAFDLFWAVYPKRVKRKTTAEIWNRKRLDSKADELIADVQQRLKSDERWRKGFIPDPTTYLNQERWGDEMTVVKRPRVEGL